MKFSPIVILATAIAVAVGLLTLLGYFVQVPVLISVRLLFAGAASLLAAVAIWAGALNLFIVHSRKLTSQSPGWLYSIFVILGMLGVLAVNAVAPFVPEWGTGPASEANRWIFRYLQTTLGTALAGMVVFFLVLAGYRLMRRRVSLLSVVFVTVAVISLLAIAPWPPDLPNPILGGASLRDLLRTLTVVPAIAGARGLLIGIALGVIATGLRVLLALDRPYGE